jgi:hypothetical protein
LALAVFFTVFFMVLALAFDFTARFADARAISLLQYPIASENRRQNYAWAGKNRNHARFAAAARLHGNRAAGLDDHNL